jgi:hypothetical protein
MCDQAYVNLLREKVRQLEAEEKRVAAFGTTPHVRFVPWVMPAQSQSQDVSNREQPCGSHTPQPVNRAVADQPSSH